MKSEIERLRAACEPRSGLSDRVTVSAALVLSVLDEIERLRAALELIAGDRAQCSACGRVFLAAEFGCDGAPGADGYRQRDCRWGEIDAQFIARAALGEGKDEV